MVSGNNYDPTRMNVHPYVSYQQDIAILGQKKTENYLAFKAKCDKLTEDIQDCQKRAESMPPEKRLNFLREVWNRATLRRGEYYDEYARIKESLEKQQDVRYRKYCEQKELWHSKTWPTKKRKTTRWKREDTTASLPYDDELPF